MISDWIVYCEICVVGGSMIYIVVVFVEWIDVDFSDFRYFYVCVCDYFEFD